MSVIVDFYIRFVFFRWRLPHGTTRLPVTLLWPNFHYCLVLCAPLTHFHDIVSHGHSYVVGVKNDSNKANNGVNGSKAVPPLIARKSALLTEVSEPMRRVRPKKAVRFSGISDLDTVDTPAPTDTPPALAGV